MDTANKDEALKCLSIAQKHYDSRNWHLAKKWISKSIALYTTPEANKLLVVITKEIEVEEQEAQRQASGGPKPASSKANTGNAKVHTEESEAGMHRRRTGAKQEDASTSSGPSKEQREYTPDQVKLVTRIRKCKVTEYYEILGLEKACDESDVKKAYRKLALQLHPDKNGAPGADEAFKMVSKAFQVLSDSNLRAAFDSSGSDPTQRGGGGGPAGFGGFRGGGGGPGMQFDGEISPEDLFNMFFGGAPAGFGGGFGGGPTVFTHSFGGGPGFSFGGAPVNRRQRRANTAQNAEPATPQSIFRQLLPLLLFVIMTFGSPIFNYLFTEPPIPDPVFSWQQTVDLSHLRRTGQDGGIGKLQLVGGVEYWVNPKRWQTHPINQQSSLPDLNILNPFEKRVEERWVDLRYRQCTQAVEIKQRQIERYSGIIFGWGADEEMLRKLQAEPIESCEELAKKWGLRVKANF